MSTIRPLPTGRITADFFADSYRLSASVLVYKRRLIDILGDRTTDYLDLADIYVSRVNSPGNIVATYPKGSLVKREINFILLSSLTESISKDRFYAPNRKALPIFIIVPSFEISGRFQWLGHLEIKKIMATEVQKFLPVLNGTARNAHFPDVTYEGPAILVNKAKIEVLCIDDK